MYCVLCVVIFETFLGAGSLTVLRRPDTPNAGIASRGRASSERAVDAESISEDDDGGSSSVQEGRRKNSSEHTGGTTSVDLSSVDSLPPTDTTEALKACSIRYRPTHKWDHALIGVLL